MNFADNDQFITLDKHNIKKSKTLIKKVILKQNILNNK